VSTRALGDSPAGEVGPGAVVGTDDVDATVVPVLDDDGPHPLTTAIDTTTTSVVEARTWRLTVRIATSSVHPGEGDTEPARPAR
jgi:hypothetical protein